MGEGPPSHTPNEPDWKILEQEEMAIGSSPDTIKTLLSVAMGAMSMGIIEQQVPKSFLK